MNDSAAMRIFIVDDHPVLRRGLKGLIDRSGMLTVVGEAGSGEEALEKIEHLYPHLVLVDIAMEGMDGLELTRHIRADYPEAEVLILSMFGDEHYVEQALEAGASGYVLKNNATDIIERAARTVLAGNQFVCPEVRPVHSI